MKFTIEKMDFITREYVRANPHKTFLFGDNLLGRGYGGQARAMRGEPNTIGIPTKKKPTNQADAFVTDVEFDQNKAAIDEAFGRLMELEVNSAIVIPSAGLGTGLAALPSKAPRTYQYLNRKLAALVADHDVGPRPMDCRN
ncbi:MAG: hypothetical protein ACRERV_18430, partial [Methylococcales bacterium]